MGHFASVLSRCLFFRCVKNCFSACPPPDDQTHTHLFVKLVEREFGHVCTDVSAVEAGECEAPELVAEGCFDNAKHFE